MAMQSPSDTPSGLIDLFWVALIPLFFCLQAVGKRVASILLTNHAKRITCLVSVYQHLATKGLMVPMDIHALNRALRVSSSDDALIFPTEFYDKIWDKEQIELALRLAGVDPHHDLTVLKDRIPDLCYELAKSTPFWISYNAKTKIADDIRFMIDRLSTVSPTSVA